VTWKVGSRRSTLERWFTFNVGTLVHVQAIDTRCDSELVVGVFHT
jgi:hypothetical protein